jgi:hypothetical protein
MCSQREFMGPDTRNLIAKQTALFIALTTLVACSSISVTSAWDPAVDFSQFKTFAVLEQTQQSINRRVDERIWTAIVAELNAKGLQQVDPPDPADLSIGYQVTTEEQTSYLEVDNRWQSHRYRSSRASWGPSIGTGTTTPVNYTVGTLVISAFQTGDKELVWEGSASGTVDPSTDLARTEQRVNDAVQRMLQDFPPRMTSAP